MSIKQDNPLLQSRSEVELQVHPGKTLCIAAQDSCFATIPVPQYPTFAGVTVRMMQMFCRAVRVAVDEARVVVLA